MLFLYNELKNILLKYTYSPTTNALQKLPLEKKKKQIAQNVHKLCCHSSLIN